MKKFKFLKSIGLLILAFVAVIFLNFFMTNQEIGRFDLSHQSIASLNPATHSFLQELSAPVKISYYVSPSSKMPSDLKHLERNVSSLLKEMRRCSEGKLNFEIIHPEDKQDLTNFLAQKRISPFKVKTIKQDEFAVTTLWSGLIISYAGQERVIPYLVSEHLPKLEEVIITLLNQMKTGYIPKVGIFAPDGYNLLKNEISKFCQTVEISSLKSNILSEIDLLFLIQPEKITSQEIFNIEEFIQSGKNILISLANYKVEKISPTKYKVVPLNTVLNDWLENQGVIIGREIVFADECFDNNFFNLEISPANINLENFVLKRSGKIYFPNASAIIINQQKMESEGLFYSPLCFTSGNAWTYPLGEKETILSSQQINSFDKEMGVYNLGVILYSDKPYQGKMFLFSSGTLFADKILERNNSNLLFINNFIRSFATPEKLVSLPISKKSSLPEIPLGSKIFLRIIIVFLVPVILLVLAILRGGIKSSSANKSLLLKQQKRKIYIPKTIVACLIILFLLGIVGISYLPSFSFDLTKGKISKPSAEAKNFIQNIKEPVEIIYLTSPPEQMPLAGKDFIRKCKNKLKDLASESNFLSFSYLEIKDLQEITPEIKDLGITPFKLKTIEQDSYLEKLIYSALIFKTAQKTEVIPHFYPQDFNRIEFLIISSIQRLIEGKKAKVVLITELPKLTPAEQFLDYMQYQLTVPKSEDVYSELRKLIADEGYQVINISLPITQPLSDADLIVYVQPFIIEEHLQNEINKHLNLGKNMIIAVQHYNIQERRYSGSGFDLVYWPQPQFTRINELLDNWGVELKKEVLFDKSSAPADIESQIRWGAALKETIKQPESKPFIIRAIAENFAPDSPITANLGDLLFIWPNRWVKNKDIGELKFVPLITTTQKSWAYNWQGGWLPEEVLAGGNYFSEKQPLVVLLEGKFSPIAKNKAKLLLIGCSEMFKNSYILSPQYDERKFILNAIADLVYGYPISNILTKGETPKRGFSPISPQQKMFFRIVNLSIIPLLFCGYGVYRWRRFYQ